MARVLAYTSPARGHLYPLVPIVDELRSRGHEIAIRTLASQVEAMQRLGFAADPIDPTIEAIEHDDYQARGPLEGMKRAMRVFVRRAEHEAPDLQAAIDATRPELLLVDINTWGAQALAETSGIPWGGWCPYPIPLYSTDLPPFGPGFAPARGLPGRLRDAVFRRLLLRSYRRAFVPALNQTRARVGAPPLTDPVGIFRSPQVLLYLTAEPFEYRSAEWPDNLIMVGPCAWEPPAKAPAWLDRITRPIVLVTTSSEFQDDARLVDCALEGLAGDDVHIVATLPAGEARSRTVPPNVHLESFVPHRPLLERAACAVTHGGMGATQKALSLGVPACVVPFGRDQLEVARRVEVAGAGSRLPAKRLTPERLREKVREAMACGAGARRVAAGFGAAGGPTAAVDAIEARLLAQRPWSVSGRLS